MAEFHIKAGHHYHQLFPLSTLPWMGEKAMERYVTFDESAQYDSPTYNGRDINKLFGLSFGVHGVHWNSARFGWRWSKSDNCIELLAYTYSEGIKNWDEQLRYPVVAQIKPGQRVYCSVKLDHEPTTGEPHFVFEVDVQDQRWLQVNVPALDNLPGYGLTHGFFFGGELSAPHDISVQIDRV